MNGLRQFYLSPIKEDLKKKMVFLSGPRQIGKTTFAKQLSGKSGTYLNWDYPEHREKILKTEFPHKTHLLVLDEIHKYRKWKNLVKGLYDVQKENYSILVTGSARLESYRRSGDSLQGRYHHYRMHPITPEELQFTKEGWEQLFKLGGFPEPFLSGSEKETKRWRREYRTRLIHEEITSLEQIQDLGTLELLSIRLPDLVGSPLSINSLREDLQVNHRTVEKWMKVLDSMYYIYQLSPFGSSKIKSVKKEKKHYQWDWSSVPQNGERFENMFASLLLQSIHFIQDTLGEEVDLHFFKDRERREVDFVVTLNQNPKLFIECKWDDVGISPHLKYCKTKFPEAKFFQVSFAGKKKYLSSEGIFVLNGLDFFRERLLEDSLQFL